MTRHLPPLNSLRAFEAAARHQSISGAANELSVTHGAISRHVTKLEEHLKQKLFQRDHNRLSLTARGDAYAKRLGSAFDEIQEATAESFGAKSSRSVLRIGMYPTFANNVLIPRLARFRERHPDIPFEIETSHTPLDPAGQDVDIAVRLGSGAWPNLASEHLFDEELLPVGSPRLLCGRTLQSAHDLGQFTLLHAAQRLNDWEEWFKSAGINVADAHSGMRFEHSGLVYQAAVNGLGLAMAQTAHVRDHLEQGHLVPVSNLRRRTTRSYFLVYPLPKATDRKIVAFVQWMKDEIGWLRQESCPSIAD